MVKVFPLEEAAKADRAHTLTHEDVAFTGNDDVLRDISAVLDAVEVIVERVADAVTTSPTAKDGPRRRVSVISVDGESGLGKSRLFRSARSVHR